MAYITIFCLILQGVSKFYLVSSLFESKNKQSVMLVRWMIAYTGMTLLSLSLDNYLGVKSIVALLSVFFMTSLLYKTKFWETVSFVTQFMLIEVVSELIVRNISVFLFNIDFTLLYQYTWTRVFVINLNTIMQAAVIYLLVQVWKSIRSKTDVLSANYKLLSLMVISQAFLIVSWTYRRDLKEQITTGVAMFAAILMSLVVDGFVLKMLMDLDRKKSEVYRLEMSEEVNLSKLKAYQDLQEKIIAMDKLRHDYKNHLSAISLILQKNDVTVAKKYVTDLLALPETASFHSFSENITIDCILNIYDEKCKKQDIDLHAEILVPDRLNITDLHICSVFSNLLDNAYAATSLLEKDRYIKIKATLQKKHLVVKCENNFDPDNLPTDGTGYGKQILSDIANQYSGIHSSEQNDGVYSSFVALKLK